MKGRDCSVFLETSLLAWEPGQAFLLSARRCHETNDAPVCVDTGTRSALPASHEPSAGVVLTVLRNSLSLKNLG